MAPTKGKRTIIARKPATAKYRIGKTSRPPWMQPLGERSNNASLHTRKKDGNCRATCRYCKSLAFDNEALNDPNHVFHDLYVCREKGRDGSPTLDHAGYELDYDKVCDWFKPTSVQSLKPTLAKTNRRLERWRKEKEEDNEMARIFYVDGAAPQGQEISTFMADAWKDRVEKDIGTPWHKIGVEDFREWEKRGFEKAKKGEYTDFSAEERKRLLDKASGCVYRK